MSKRKKDKAKQEGHGRQLEFLLVIIALLFPFYNIFFMVPQRFFYIWLVNLCFYFTSIIFVYLVIVLFREREGKMILVSFLMFSGINLLFYLSLKPEIMIDKLVRSFLDKSYILPPYPDECISNRDLNYIDKIIDKYNDNYVFCIYGASGTGKSYYFRRQALKHDNVLYVDARIGQEIEVALHQVIFERDNNLPLYIVEFLYKILAIGRLFPEKRSLETIFNHLIQNKDQIFMQLGNRKPLIIIDNFNDLVRKDDLTVNKFYDYIKHVKDQQYVNLLLVSNEGGPLLNDMEAKTSSRIDSFVHIRELTPGEVGSFMNCCLDASKNKISSLYRSHIVNQTNEYIGGNIHFLQSLCYEMMKYIQPITNIPL